MKDLKRIIGIRIKELRKRNSFTQEQLAELIGTDQRTLSAIECGINFPSKHIDKLAKAFNVEIKDLFDVDYIKNREILIKESISMIEKLDKHDLDIIYKLLKFMKKK